MQLADLNGHFCNSDELANLFRIVSLQFNTPWHSVVQPKRILRGWLG